jgi:hypothetical protein
MKAEARVLTPNGARYAKQLCGHAAWKTPRSEWSPPDGVIEFPDKLGTCRMTAEPDRLALVAEALNEANLARIQQVVGSNIERFGSREGLSVRWIRA